MRELHVDQAPVYKIPFGGTVPDRLPDAGRTVVITDSPASPTERAEMQALVSRRAQFASKLAALQPALIVEVRRDAVRRRDYFTTSVLMDPGIRPLSVLGPPIVALNGDAGAGAYDGMPAGATNAVFTAHVNAPVGKSAPQHNVIGVLPGSDSALAGTYVLVTAHYDGQGTRPGPDSVWNSANDNGSGTASVVALAAALSGLQKRADYHGAADTWQKIDYENMARTVRMIGTALIGIADSRQEPRWDPALARATRYLEAWRKLHGAAQRP